MRHYPITSALRDSPGGTLSSFGDKACLNVSSNETTQNADGSTTFTSISTGLGFALEDGEWRISDD